MGPVIETPDIMILFSYSSVVIHDVALHLFNPLDISSHFYYLLFKLTYAWLIYLVLLSDFLNVDDDDLAEMADDYMPDAEDTRHNENIGWSSRTR